MDQDLLNIIDTRITQDLDDRRNYFNHEINQIKETMNFRHMYHSSITVKLIVEAIDNEYRIRTSLIWQSFARGIKNKGIIFNKETAEEVKKLLVKMLDNYSPDLASHYSDLKGIMKIQKPPKKIEELRAAAIERIFTEIDFVSIEPSQKEKQTPSFVNIYQGYGIVQTGSGSTASLTVNLGPQERSEVNKVIEAMNKLFVDSKESLKPEQQTEAKELVADLESEIKRAEPNKHRIRGALQGLANIVQTIAAVPQVYQLIKGAAALFGLQLP
jgi:hypothetical protein